MVTRRYRPLRATVAGSVDNTGDTAFRVAASLEITPGLMLLIRAPARPQAFAAARTLTVIAVLAKA